MIEIKEKKHCTGCSACSNICPLNGVSMVSDNEGFEYPKANIDVCIKCGKCITVCPIKNKTTIDNIPSAFACINKDDSIRLESSSGGIFTLIAEQIIKDNGIVFGAEFNECFEVNHSYITTKEDIQKLRRSKYVQSKVGSTYTQVKEFLDLGKKVLFSGTPCQIGGLKSFLNFSRKGINNSNCTIELPLIYDNLICIDIICHGVPSPAVWEKYVEYQAEKNVSNIKSIFFRQKKEGWKLFSLAILFENGREYCKNLKNDLYLRAFLNDICLRPSCYDCSFKTLHRQSDITLADFWGIQHILPEMDDDKGTSLVFINSKKGQFAFDQIHDKMLYKEVDINKAVKYNSFAIKSAKYNPKRDDFFVRKDKESFDLLVEKYCAEKLISKIKKHIFKLIKPLLQCLKKGDYT